jgi:hypothetical protein
MSINIHKSHNVSVLIYHLVCPAKYRKVVFDETIDLPDIVPGYNLMETKVNELNRIWESVRLI